VGALPSGKKKKTYILFVIKHIWIRRHYQRMTTSLHSVDIVPGGTSGSRGTISSLYKSKEPREGYELRGASSSRSLDKVGAEASQPCLAADSASKWSVARMIGLRGTHRASPSLANNAKYQAMRKMLLLNSYPFAYIILWTPGIANRLIEASGHTSNVMQILQASTQLVGLTNALMYGWNERIAMRVRERFRD
jgi:hypothetical protein